MFNNFFTPQQISPLKKQSFQLNFNDKYDFSSLLQKDLFQIVSPHVQSISDQKRKIISWLKKIPLIQRMNILTYTNKEFVCLVRTMYQKKQPQYQEESSITFTISHFEQTDEFDLMSMSNTKKLTKQYIQAQDNLLSNIKIMSRYTPFDSITFSDNYIRNIDTIFHNFDILGDGISHQLTYQDYQRLKKLPNYVMFYDQFQQHCYKKASIGTWITQTFIKHISMMYLQYQINQKFVEQNQLKNKFKQIQKFWKIIGTEKKNQIIKKVLQKKPIELYQQHRQIIKVTRNGFPRIQKSNKVPALLKSIMESNEKQIVEILYYNNLQETIESHSILKYYITLEIEDQIRKYNDQIKRIQEENKMKKKKKKNNKILNNKFQEDNETHSLIKNNQLKSSSNVQKQIKQKILYQSLNDHKIKTENLNNKNIKEDNNKQKEIQQKQEKLKQDRNKVIVKGTDLFYKKLEISQTQQIICIPSTFSTNIKIQQQQKNQQTQPLLQKPKKKRKNKKKKNNHLQTHEQEHEGKGENQEQEIHVKDHVIQQAEIIKDKIVIQKYQRKSSSSKSTNNDKLSQKSSQTTNDHVQEAKDSNKHRKPKHQQEKTKQNQLEENDPLQQIMKQINKSISFYNKQRKIIINRLTYILSQHDLSFKLYGSAICDVALPSSDIDIVVDPSIVNYFYFSYSNYKKKIINSLEYIEKIFQKYQWADDFILLPGATIPLLTFTVNPTIDFDVQGNNSHQYNNKKEIKQEIKISVDVTIQPYINMTDEVPMHLGVESTEIINQWVSLYPFYRQMLILLKLFTKNKNLNKLYHGGISSFMQSIILAGFYKNFFMNLMNGSWNDFQNKKQKFQEILPLEYKNLTRIFIEYCVFIQKFQQDKSVLDIYASQSIVPKPSNIPRQQLAIVNPLTGKIMSQRCTTFVEYRKMIHQVQENLLMMDKKENNQKFLKEARQQLKRVFEI